MRRIPFLAAFSLLLVIAAPAMAANGFTTANVNLRAGPSTGYPVVTTVPANSPVQIFGCVKASSWCDTQWLGQRGWVSSAYLSAAWRQAPYVVYDRNAYYNRYYVGRPWYAPRVFIGPNRQCYRGRFVVACR
jgi:uncharacterized protein YraI